MANIRNRKHEKGYTVLDNRGVDCPDISYRATGLWAYVKSKPEDWEISVTHLAKQKKKEGRDAIYAALNELIEARLVIKSEVRKKGKFGGTIYDFYDYPLSEIEVNQPLTDSQDVVSPLTEKPDTALPDTGNPDTANPTVISTDLISTKRTSTEKEIKEGDAREKNESENFSSPEEKTPTPRPIKTDKYFGQQKQTQLERHQAIANQHAVKDSPFQSVDEQDNFFAYLTSTLAKESNVTPDKARVFANAACRRLLANQSDPNDRQHLKEFRSGLERVSRGDELLTQISAIEQDLFRRIAS